MLASPAPATWNPRGRRPGPTSTCRWRAPAWRLEGSLLGADEVAAAIEAAGDVSFGLKIALRPKDQTAEEKLAGLDENAALILGARG